MTTTATTKSLITDEQAALVGTRWEKNGTVRYYINNWAELAGFEIDRSHSGAIRSCHIPGVDMISNRKAENLLCGKVYIQDGKILSEIDWDAAGISRIPVGDAIRAEIARRAA